MSLHRSFAIKGRAGSHRNVLSRAERMARLREEERWPEGRSVFGLPKVRSIKPKKKAKAAKKTEAAEAPAAAAPAAEKSEKGKPAAAKGADKK